MIVSQAQLKSIYTGCFSKTGISDESADRKIKKN